MKKLFSILLLTIPAVFAEAQEAAESSSSGSSSDHPKYFLATNSGILKTPVGFRIGIIEKMGGYIGMRFGKGYKFEEDRFNNNQVEAVEATLFAADAGLIFPVATKKAFQVHTFLGLGYGKWFDRPSQNGQTVGVEVEGGFMFSYRRFMINLGGCMLTGDGKSPKGDMTAGVGFRF